MKVTNYLLGYKDLYLVQDTDMFNFSLDSVLLPNFITINKNAKKIMDIGCGNAPIPIILSTKCDAEIVGVEVQKKVYDLALESIKINKLENKISIINDDINAIYKNFNHSTFDIITCNPPYFKYIESSNINKNEFKTIARHEVLLNLSQLMIISKYLLKNNGIIGIVHRPERVTDVIECMRNNNIEPKRIQFVYPHIDEEANIVLIEGRKNGRPGLKVLPPIISHDVDGNYTKQVEKFFVNN